MMKEDFASFVHIGSIGMAPVRGVAVGMALWVRSQAMVAFLGHLKRYYITD
jgi:hypothetical protein